jgi:hypothetical protein
MSSKRTSHIRPHHLKPYRKDHAGLKAAATTHDPDVEKFQKLYLAVMGDQHRHDLGYTGPHGNGVDGNAGPLTEAAKARYLCEYGCSIEDIGKTSYARVNAMLEGNLRARAENRVAHQTPGKPTLKPHYS